MIPVTLNRLWATWCIAVKPVGRAYGIMLVAQI